jgi:hypothetical protein
MLSANEYDRTKYNQDFPSIGNFNWVAVQVTTPNDKYYDGCKLTGVLLHDGNFMGNNMLFSPNEFKILSKETEEIKELLGYTIKRR